jgi:hypothetical protein
MLDSDDIHGKVANQRENLADRHGRRFAPEGVAAILDDAEGVVAAHGTMSFTTARVRQLTLGVLDPVGVAVVAVRALAAQPGDDLVVCVRHVRTPRCVRQDQTLKPATPYFFEDPEDRIYVTLDDRTVRFPGQPR